MSCRWRKWRSTCTRSTGCSFTSPSICAALRESGWGLSATCRRTTAHSVPMRKGLPATGAIGAASRSWVGPASATMPTIISCPSVLPDRPVAHNRAAKGADMTAFVFPGQGSQKVGMGAELAEASATAREVFEEVDEALGQALSRIMREGPDDALTLTENAQPAIMAHAIAVLRVLERDCGVAIAAKGECVAGHSLGEYTALCAAGAFSLADTARLLKLRGQAMQAAVPVGIGAMCALLGADLEKASALAEAAADGEVCQVANDNDPGQVVLS